MWYQNIGSMFYSFVTKHACDGQTELRSQDRASIAASRGKNYFDESEFIWCYAAVVDSDRQLKNMLQSLFTCIYRYLLEDNWFNQLTQVCLECGL